MNCDLEVILDHFDHICQIAGNADHIGIGSDLDGAFCREQAPHDLETIADLGRRSQRDTSTCPCSSVSFAIMASGYSTMNPWPLSGAGPQRSLANVFVPPSSTT